MAVTQISTQSSELFGCLWVGMGFGFCCCGVFLLGFFVGLVSFVWVLGFFSILGPISGFGVSWYLVLVVNLEELGYSACFD